jgi:hypothetical protein
MSRRGRLRMLGLKAEPKVAPVEQPPAIVTISEQSVPDPTPVSTGPSLAQRSGHPALTDWKPMDMAPRHGEEIWVAGNGMIRPAKWISAADGEDGFWSDLWLTAGYPTPRRLMFQPVAWASED